MSDIPALIVGLGNPGNEHSRDRHNAGYWLVDALAQSSGVNFRSERKLQGEACQMTGPSGAIRLLKPTTYMNRSGESVRRALDYFKLSTDQILIAHDDLDLPPGVARFKKGGGHGGNNGLRDLIAHCGKDFLRLRIGIGHPGSKQKVVGYVLRPPAAADLAQIESALHEAQRSIDTLLKDGLERAMTQLHTATARVDDTLNMGPAG